MSLSIVIVSYNTPRLLQSCLLHVFEALTFAKLENKSEIIVVDNASSDDSVELLKKNFPKVKLILNKKNLGFAKANNQGIKKAKGEFILLLNSDTEVKKDAFLIMLSKLEKNNKIGALGPKLLNKDGTSQQSVGYFPSLIKVFFWMSFIDDLPILSLLLKPYHVKNISFYNQEQEVNWVSGACILVRAKTVKKAGLLDEKIFMYGEEVEWCYRIKKSGFNILYTPYTEIIHLKGASGTGVASGIVEEFAALIYIYNKHKSKFSLLLLKLFLMFGALFRLFLFGIIMRDSNRSNLYAQAFRLVRR